MKILHNKGNINLFFSSSVNLIFTLFYSKNYRKTLQGSNSPDEKDVPQIKEGLLNVKIISINGRVNIIIF